MFLPLNFFYPPLLGNFLIFIEIWLNSYSEFYFKFLKERERFEKDFALYDKFKRESDLRKREMI